MNEMEAKKCASDTVRHMLGGAPGTKVAWGEGLAMFWCTPVYVDRLSVTGKLLAAVGFSRDEIALEDIVDWSDMGSLSSIKIDNFKIKLKRKGFFHAINETVRLNIGHKRPSLGVELYQARDGDITGLYITRHVR